MMKSIDVEVCCGGLGDALAAARFPIARIELNGALELGGLTPSVSTLREVKKNVSVPVMTMVRPRGAGFCYSLQEKQIMFLDAEVFLKEGADGIVFGFLNPDHSVDEENTRKMVDLIHSYGKTAVFHRAFDNTRDCDEAIAALMRCHVDRVLTSGHRDTCLLGADEIKHLIDTYGNSIEILPGCGVRPNNVLDLLKKTGSSQVHLSARTSLQDDGAYDAVSAATLNQVFEKLRQHRSDADHLRSEDMPAADEDMLKSDRYEDDIEGELTE